MPNALRTQTFSESVIRGMTRLAQKHGAINLAQGFPAAGRARSGTCAGKSRNSVIASRTNWGTNRFTTVKGSSRNGSIA